MNWQLWVAIGIVAAVVLLLAATRMRHAQHVFHDITQVERPVSEARADELAPRRSGRVSPEQGRHRRHG